MRSLVLIVAALMAYLLLRGWPVGLHPLMATCLAVLALVLGFGLWPGKHHSPHPRAVASRRPGWTDYLALGIAVLALECLLVILLATAPPRAEALAGALELRLHPESRTVSSPQATGDGNGSGKTGLSGNWLWDQHGQRRLPMRSSAVPSNKPEAFLRPADEGSIRALLNSRPYLHAFALERYEESAWQVGPLTRGATGDDDGWLNGEGGLLEFPVPPRRPARAISTRVYHARHLGGQDVFLALQGVVSTDVPRLREMAPGILRLPPAPTPAGYDYMTTSRPVTFDQLVTGSTLPAIIPEPDAPAHLLALPEDPLLRDSILQIAVKTQGSLDARLLALRRFLTQNCTYSLTVENPQGLDPLENFLFHERRGHCEHFASAGALLCRSLGIPARIAYGWAGGRYYSSNNLFLFRAREAHAWTEILIKDVGWVVFDLTPADAQEAATATIAPEDEAPPLPGQNPDLETAGDLVPPSWIRPLLGAGLGLAILAMIILRLRRRPERDLPHLRDPLLPPEPGYLTRFRHASTRRGHPMPPGRTLHQHLDALRENREKITYSEDLLDYHYAVTYGSAPSDRTRERQLIKEIKRWEERA